MPPSHRPTTGQQQRVRHYARNADLYAMFNLLTGPPLLDRVERLLPAHRQRLYPPTEPLLLFLAQALLADGRCQQVVNDTAVKRVIGGLKPASTDTGAYCKVRSRLPEARVSTLTRESGGILAEGAASGWQGRGRAVRLGDGATVTLADTPENQAAYPQPTGQKAGRGLALCRGVGLLCLGSGALLDAASGPCKGKGGDEQELLRSILDSLDSGDILLGDAYYATDFLLCDLIQGGVEGLFEPHGGRKRRTDFSLGERLGVGDQLIVLTQPKKRPEWRSPYEYDHAPDTLKVREFQAGGTIMVTPFLGSKKYPKSVLKALYRQRWNGEPDLRNIKTTLGMEPRRCKTPPMAIQELWVDLLAYNLIRLLMAQAALVADQIPPVSSASSTRCRSGWLGSNAAGVVTMRYPSTPYWS